MNEKPELIIIDLIVANPYQVRQAEDPAVVAELAENIKRNGLLQPPTVRLEKNGSNYQLAFGHTRLAAYKHLDKWGNEGFEKMPCFIRDLDDLQMFEMAVAENIKRRDLNPIERAKAMQTYMDTFKKTSAETGDFFNCDEATVRGSVRLLGLPENAQAKLSSGEITIGIARQLLMLARVAPDTIDFSIEQIMKGDRPVEKVIADILDDLAYKNKAIKMWAHWNSGKPSAGPGLWELDMPTSKIAKNLLPLSTLGDVEIRLGKKALPGAELTAQNRPLLEDWVNKLHSGLVDAEALIAQGADPETITRLDQLIHPPACTACSFHVQAGGNHYCAWKVCHTRKKEAWSLNQLVKAEKELGISCLGADEAKGGYVPVDQSWDQSDKALFEKRDPNLRLRIKPQQYDHAFTGSEIIQLVTIAPEAFKAAKEEKKGGSDHGSQAEQRKQWEREQKLQDASYKFQETEAEPLFATLLSGIDNLGFLMAMANMTDRDFEREENGEKKLTRKEKLYRCRIGIIHDVLDNATDYESREEGPTATARFLEGIAKSWGLDLPGDWLERAKRYEPETVPAETTGQVAESDSAVDGPDPIVDLDNDEMSDESEAA